MTVIFFCTCLLGWCLGLLLHRTAAATPVTSVVGFEPRSSRVPPTGGVEDDPVRWPPAVVRGDWTALDERQLIRLLTDSAHESTRTKPHRRATGADERGRRDANPAPPAEMI